MGEKIGYGRVSTVDQNPARQQAALNDAGVTRFYLDRASGKNITARPQLAAMLDFIREGDELLVTSLDRLARSLPDLLSIVDSLTSKGVRVTFLSHGLTFTRDEADATGRLMLSMLGAFAEFERTLIHERQREGIEQARARGTYKGRKPTDPEKIEHARALVAQGLSVSSAARRAGVSRSVLTRAGVRMEVQS